MPADDDESHVALRAILARLATDASADSERVAEAELATFLERYAVEVESSLQQSRTDYPHSAAEASSRSALSLEHPAPTRHVRSSEEVVASSLMKLMALTDIERTIAKHVYLSADVPELYGGEGLRKLLERCGALTPPGDVLEALVREVVSGEDDARGGVGGGAAALNFPVNLALPSFDPLIITAAAGTLTARLAARVGVAVLSSARRRQLKPSALSTPPLALPVPSTTARPSSPAEGEAGSGALVHSSPRMLSSGRKVGLSSSGAASSARRSPKATGSSYPDRRDGERTTSKSTARATPVGAHGATAETAKGVPPPFITLQVFWQCLQRLKRRQFDEVIRHSQSLAEQTLSDALNCVVEECRASGAGAAATREGDEIGDIVIADGGASVHREDVDGYLRRVFGLRWMPTEPRESDSHNRSATTSAANVERFSAANEEERAMVTSRTLWRVLQPTPRAESVESIRLTATSPTLSYRDTSNVAAANSGIPPPSTAGGLGSYAANGTVLPRLAISDVSGSSSLRVARYGESSTGSTRAAPPPVNAANLSGRSTGQPSSRLSDHNGSMHKSCEKGLEENEDFSSRQQQQQQQPVRGSSQILFLPSSGIATAAAGDGTPASSLVTVPPALRGTSEGATQPTGPKRLSSPSQHATTSTTLRPLSHPALSSVVTAHTTATTPGRGGRVNSFGSRAESASPTGSTDQHHHHHHHHHFSGLHGGRDGVEKELDAWSMVDSRPASPHSSAANGGLSRPGSCRLQEDLRRASFERKAEYQRRLSALKRSIFEKKLMEQGTDASRLSRRKSLCALKALNHGAEAEHGHEKVPDEADTHFAQGVGRSLSPEKRYELLGGLGLVPSLYTTHGNKHIYQRGLDRLRHHPQKDTNNETGDKLQKMETVAQRSTPQSAHSEGDDDADSECGPRRLVRCHSASVQGPRIAGSIRRQAAAALSAYAATRFTKR